MGWAGIVCDPAPPAKARSDAVVTQKLILDAEVRHDLKQADYYAAGTTLGEFDYLDE